MSGMRAAGARALAAAFPDLVDAVHAEEEGVRRGVLLAERLAERGTAFEHLVPLASEWLRGWNAELLRMYGPPR